MPYSYGGIVGTQGIDDKPVDVIYGPFPTLPTVYVVTMPLAVGGEDKILVGFLNAKAAKKAFLSCYGGKIAFFGKMRSTNIIKLKQLLIARRGKSLFAGVGEGDNSYGLGVLEPVPTGWNTKVENPGDTKLSKEEQLFNTELARRQGPPTTYVEVSQGWDQNISPSQIVSSRRVK